MKHSDPELVWQGRLHLGDGPGVYGDAPYAGLNVELPFTVRRFPDAQGTALGTLMVETEGLQARTGQSSPNLSVVRYARDADAHWDGGILLEQPLTGEMTTVQLNLGNAGVTDEPLALSVRLRTNTDAQPGLYADFVLVALRFDCATHYASLGFQTAT